MKKILLLFLLSICSQTVLASEQFLVTIKYYQNNILRGTPRMLTTFENRAEIRQTAGDYYLSRAVLLQKSSTPNSIKLNLNIEEQLASTSFSLDDVSEISTLEGHKTITVRSGSDVFRYDVTITPYTNNTIK